MRPVIVLTNDDGIDSPGLSALVRALRGMGRLFVVAPKTMCSACSHSITIRSRIEVGDLGERDGAHWFAVRGTPGDCILYAMPEVVRQPVDLVVSGINFGANIGVDVHYSGTVAGARQATLQGIPSIAVSIDSRKPKHLETAAEVAARWAKILLALESKLPLCLCINVPDVAHEQLRGEMLVRQDLADVSKNFGGHEGVTTVGDEWPSDTETLNAQMVSVLPLVVDLTSRWGLRVLEDLEVRFWSRGREST